VRLLRISALIIVCLCFVAVVHGQTYLCSQLNQRLNSQVPPGLNCGAQPSAVNFSYLWTINGLNTHTGVVYNLTTPTETVMGYCGGGGSNGNCAYGYGTSVSQQNGNFVWIFTAHNTPPGGNPGFNGTPMQGWGCAVQTLTNADPVRVPIQNCPCVSSTCGQNGPGYLKRRPASLDRPTPPLFRPG
jgi:hypothetical protein